MRGGEVEAPITDRLHEFMWREALTPKGEDFKSSRPYSELCFDKNLGYHGGFIPKLPLWTREEFAELVSRFGLKDFEGDMKAFNIAEKDKEHESS